MLSKNHKLASKKSVERPIIAAANLRCNIFKQSIGRWHLIEKLLTLFSASMGLQKFAEQPKYTEVNPGEDALLMCKIIDKRGTCSWQKDNKVCKCMRF